MNTILMNELKNQNDPRLLGKGDIFDNYGFDNPANWNFYERYKNGETDPDLI